MPHSHHAHSGQFCRHAKDTLAEVVDEAARKGFKVFGLTEHAPRYRTEDLYPEEADLTPADLAATYDAFLAEAGRLRALRAALPDNTLQLLVGIESDYITQLDADGLGALLARNTEIDYVVGSVHHVNGVPIDFDRATYLRSVISASAYPAVSDDDPRLADGYVPTPAELEPFFCAYLDAQHTLLQRHQPEVVGHFDLCLLYTPDVSLSAAGADVWARVERNVRCAVEYGALFECNAAAIRKGWVTSYPGQDVLNLILSLGGRLCLSDDSHGTVFVGLNYAKMRDYLLGAGVKDVYYLVPAAEAVASDDNIGQRRRVVTRKCPGWAEDPFWETLRKANEQS